MAELVEMPTELVGGVIGISDIAQIVVDVFVITYFNYWVLAKPLPFHHFRYALAHLRRYFRHSWAHSPSLRFPAHFNYFRGALFIRPPAFSSDLKDSHGFHYFLVQFLAPPLLPTTVPLPC